MRKLLEGRIVCAAASVTIAVLLCGTAVSQADLGVESHAISVRIKRQTVDSTNLASVGYNQDARVLEIEFKSGAVYRYFAVPPAIVEELMRATSKGRFFAREIRSKYEFRCVCAARP